jgi:hypothetical protein
MSMMTRDPWQEALNDSGGIEGVHIKCAKGVWTFDDDVVETGDGGVQICIVMESALHGQVRWEDRKIVEREVERYEDAAPSTELLDDDWSPYTQVQCVGVDAAHVGRLMTFTSSSWGGRRAFSALLGPYVRKGRREFPICTLGTRPKKNDPNGNIDPTFAVVGWAPRADFAEMLPAPTVTLEAPKAAAALSPPKTIDDLIATADPLKPSKAKPKARASKPGEIDDDIPW